MLNRKIERDVMVGCIERVFQNARNVLFHNLGGEYTVFILLLFKLYIYILQTLHTTYIWYFTDN